MARASSRSKLVNLGPRLAELAVWALLLCVPLLVVPTAKDSFRLPKLMLSEVFVLASLVPLAASLHRLPRVSLRQVWALPAVRGLAPLLAVVSLGWLWSEHPLLVRQGLIELWIGAAALVGWSVGLGRERLERCLRGLLWPAALLALLAILQLHGFHPFQFASGEEMARLGVTSLAGNPGDLSDYLLLPALIAQLELYRERGRRRGIAAVALGLVLYGLAVSQTLTGLAAVAVASLVLWASILPWRRWVAAVAVMGVLLAALGLGVPPLRQRLQVKMRELSDESLNAVLSGRLDGWYAALWMTRERPWVGVGQGAYQAEFIDAKRQLLDRGVKLYQRHGYPTFLNAHNEVLEATAEWGLLGLAALVWALVVLWRRLPRPHQEPLAVAGLVGLGVLAMGHFPFRLALVAYPALLFLAWVLCIGEGSGKGGSKEAEAQAGAGKGLSGRLLAGVLVALLVLALVVQVGRSQRLVRADRVLKAVEVTTVQLAAAGRLQPSVLYANLRVLGEAHRLDPARADILLAQGGQYLLLRKADDALELYDQALRLQPSPEIYLNRGRAYLLSGQTAAAREDFELAVRLHPALRKAVPTAFRPDRGGEPKTAPVAPAEVGSEDSDSAEPVSAEEPG